MAGVAEQAKASKGSPRRRPIKISYVETGVDENSAARKPFKEVRSSPRSSGLGRTRVYPEGGRAMVDGDDAGADGTKKRRNKKNLRVNVARSDDDKNNEASPSRTPDAVRGSRDLRSPGQKKTPKSKKGNDAPALPDFITQTDANGNATTPRSAAAIQGARVQHPSGPRPHLHVQNGTLVEENVDKEESRMDPCETIVDGLRMMCCCLLPEVPDEKGGRIRQLGTQDTADTRVDKVRLLGPHHPDDIGKKCLVLDLDETLVHSSFRAVPGADFVIPVQIEDVVHFVYVAKRPGVDEFLVEMAKHYEIVIYTASLNKYADPLLDLLDPHNVIRTRLFRESCAYYEGNYVKDLSLLDRDLSQMIIIDNSPSSYMFHPENAIDCSSFIDDPNDRELDQIGAFLAGVKQSKDVRGLCHQWRDWPVVEELQDEV